jgi:hypothetical protein
MHQESSADQRSETSQGQRRYRVCRSCCGIGAVVEETKYDSISGTLTQAVVRCPICESASEVSMFLYATPGGRA